MQLLIRSPVVQRVPTGCNCSNIRTRPYVKRSTRKSLVLISQISGLALSRAWQPNLPLWRASGRTAFDTGACSGTLPFRGIFRCGATTVGLCLFAAAVSTQLPTSRGAVHIQTARKPVIVALNNQAQIESLSATSTVLVWNEPTSNATVIWVDETPGEKLP